MRRALFPLALLLAAAAPAVADDPYLWLEEIEGPRITTAGRPRRHRGNKA